MTAREPVAEDSDPGVEPRNTVSRSTASGSPVTPLFRGSGSLASSNPGPTRPAVPVPTFHDLAAIMDDVGHSDAYARMYELAQSVPHSDFGRWLTEVDSAQNRRYGEPLVHQLLTRWAEIDPAAARDFALASSGKWGKQHRLGIVIGVWAKRDFSAAERWWRALPEGSTKDLALNGLTQALGSLLKVDPDRALDFVTSLRAGNGRNMALQTAAGEWARHDFDAAVAWWRGLPENGEKWRALDGLMQALWSGVRGEHTKSLEFAMSLPSSERRSRTIQAALGAWAQHDFGEALAWVRRLPDGGDKHLALTALGQQMGSLAGTDPEAALTFAMSLQSSESRNRAIQTAGSAWAATDLDAAVSRLHNMDPGTQQNAFLQGICSQWALRDPQAAAAFVATLPRGQNTDGMITQIARAWAVTDVWKALEWAESLGAGGARQTAISSVVNQWSQTEPAEAIAYLSEMPAGAKRNQALRAAAAQWLQSDAAAAMMWLATQPAKLRVDVIGSSYHQLANTQPEVLAELCGALLPSGQDRPAIVGRIAGYWAHYDVPGVAAWVQTLENPQERKSAFDSICAKWAEYDPEAAAVFVSGVHNDQTRREMLSTLAACWSRNDSAKAIAWAESLDDEGVRNAAICSIVKGISSADPETAAELVSRLPEGKEQESAIMDTLSNWVGNDPVAAIQWLDSFADSDFKWRATAHATGQWASEAPDDAAELALSIPDEKQMAGAVANVVGQWGRYDVVGAGLFLQTLDSGPVRDAAVQSYCDNIVQYYPSAAAEWAESIGDGSRRSSQMERVAQQWVRGDREAAIDWIRSSSLPEETKARLLANAEKQQGR